VSRVDERTREELAVEYGRLEASNRQLEAVNRQLEAENHWLKEQFRLAQGRRFGASSERTLTETSQGELIFNEAEAVADSTPEIPESETITYTRKRKSVGHREEMLRDLPTETREYRLPAEEQVCSACGGHLHEMSSQTRDELLIIPAQVKVLRHVKYVYGCRKRPTTPTFHLYSVVVILSPCLIKEAYDAAFGTS
jgi:transposase